MNPFLNYFQSFIVRHKLSFLVQLFYFSIIIYFFHWLWWSGGLKSMLIQLAFFHQTETFLAHQVFLPASWMIKHLLGYSFHQQDNTLIFSKKAYIAIEGSCSGLKQFYQWIILMILFPGLWKRKLWYIPMGIITIHAYNILRIVILSIVIKHWPMYWNFIHYWIMRPMYYAVIFILWVGWIEKISFHSQKKPVNKYTE